MVVRSLIACAVLLAAGVFPLVHSDRAIPMNQPFESFPQAVKSWRMVDQAVFSEGVLAQLRPTDYLSRNYMDQGTGRRVGLYIGFHDGGPDAGEIHSPRHCLPGSGWEQITTHPVTISAEGVEHEVVVAVYRQDKTETIFLYWFQAMGEVYQDEYTLKLAEFKNSLLHGRKDAAFIRLTVPVLISREDSAEVAKRFAEDFLPAIHDYLPL